MLPEDKSDGDIVGPKARGFARGLVRLTKGRKVQMAEFPEPVVYGTIGYLVACAFALLCLKIMQMFGGLTKDNTGVGFTVVITGTICMWLIWVMAWFHQWHPLIVPEYP